MNDDHGTVVVPPWTRYYYDRSPADIAALHDRDMALGSVLDSAGEPKVYCDQGMGTTTEAHFAVVVKTRGIRWRGWGRRPTHLIEVMMTFEGVPKVVKIRDPRKCKPQHQHSKVGP